MAVGEDGSPGSQVPEMIGDQAGVSLTPNPAQPAGAKRHAFHDQEQWLLEEERRLLAMESRAVDWVRATTAGTCFPSCSSFPPRVEVTRGTP
jgi:hypothetical protein